jgi:hypothetical protein
MNLQELQQVKKDLDQGVLVSKKTWLQVLEWATELTKHHEAQKQP